MSKAALWATSTAPRANSQNDGSASAAVGARATIASVMPVSALISGGMPVPGWTSVWNSPSTSPPRTRTAPISVMDASGPDPVVSRSTTTKDVAASGWPRSSRLGWRPAVMVSTLGARSDIFPVATRPRAAGCHPKLNHR